VIIADFAQIAMASYVHNKDCTDDNFELARHMILNSLRMYNKKHRKEYGEMVIATEGRKSWRKVFFEYYKAQRKLKRNKDNRDWKLIFSIIQRVQDEIAENAPWRLINQEGAEGDDIIGVLTLTTQEFGMGEPVLILSSDRDFVQLHRFQNVRQYSTIQKKWVQCDDIGRYMIKHCVKGDSGDGVPNIKSRDDIFVTEGRQSNISAKFLEDIYNNKNDLSKVLTKLEIKRFNRNKKLVDLDMIDEDVKKGILEQYNKPFNKGMRKSKFLNYLVKNRMGILAGEIGDFY